MTKLFQNPLNSYSFKTPTTHVHIPRLLINQFTFKPIKKIAGNKCRKVLSVVKNHSKLFPCHLWEIYAFVVVHDFRYYPSTNVSRRWRLSQQRGTEKVLLVLSIQRPAFVDIFITGEKEVFFRAHRFFAQSHSMISLPKPRQWCREMPQMIANNNRHATEVSYF